MKDTKRNKNAPSGECDRIPSFTFGNLQTRTRKKKGKRTKEMSNNFGMKKG